MQTISPLRRNSGIAIAVLVAAAASSAPCQATSPGGWASLALPTYTHEMPTMPAMLEASGAVIGTVTIDPGNIFDLDNPAENSFLYRLANKAHIKTRPAVIEQQLLFNEGEPFSARLMNESERILRKNRYLQDANIEPALGTDGDVDMLVHTADTWSLVPKFSFSRSGGTNDTNFGIRETNLIGTGIELEVLFSSDVDRTGKMLKVHDSHLGDSWYDLGLRLEDNSDGRSDTFTLVKPFYSLDSTDANGLAFFDDNRIESYYDLGEIVGQYRQKSRNLDAFRGWSKGLKEGSTTRYYIGLGYDERQFSSVESVDYPQSVIPEDRKYVYPYVGIEWTQDQYEKAYNFDQIKRTEDRFVGSRFSARVGPAAEAFGSDRNALIVNLDGQTAFGNSESKSVVLAGTLVTRLEQGGFQDLFFDTTAKYYARHSEKSLFFASVDGSYGKHLDLDHQMLLGGDNGLRGYPLRYQAGDKRALVTLEERYYTDWYPFRLFRVGAAVFFDVGRTWGESSVVTTNQGWLKDVGVGLRLGSSRSGLGNIVHVDLAFPLDGDSSIDSLQILVEAKDSF
jgi:outer membrane protein assembly factor BamA